MDLQIAYSPDSDDMFMVYALRKRITAWGRENFSFHQADIQSLNLSALSGYYDVSAISFAIYPLIQDVYNLLDVGASVGRNYGPKIVTRKDTGIQHFSDLKDRTIALPGKHTSTYLAALSLLPNFKPIFMHFCSMGDALNAKKVDAVILIHEQQLMIHQKSHWLLVGDIGKIWYDTYQLPLPLGGNVIRKSLPITIKRSVQTCYQESIRWALKHRETVLETFSKDFLYPLSLTREYLDKYVNEDSLALSKDVKRALSILYQKAQKTGNFSSVLSSIVS